MFVLEGCCYIRFISKEKVPMPYGVILSLASGAVSIIKL